MEAILANLAILLAERMAEIMTLRAQLGQAQQRIAALEKAAKDAIPKAEG